MIRFICDILYFFGIEFVFFLTLSLCLFLSERQGAVNEK